MQPEPGVRLTLVAREPHTPYSGMLPGYIAGKYNWDDLHIDLLKLSTFAQTRFIADEVTGLDPEAQTVTFQNRPPLYYDLLSINIGGQPGVAFEGDQKVVPVKPIGRFLPAWEAIVASHTEPEPTSLCLVGGGVGSVELALAIRERYSEMFELQLVTADAEILQAHHRLTRKKALKELAAAGVEITTDFQARDYSNGLLTAEDDRTVEADHVLSVAGVEAQTWIRDSGLDVDDQGFVNVDRTMRSTSHPNVFAAGDVANMVAQTRPKSGVFAVRSGPVLARNLRAAISNRRLKTYRAQKTALALIRLPGDRAIADKGRWYQSGSLLWLWKDWIDRRFIAKFVDLPSMELTVDPSGGLSAHGLDTGMRCGGCGAKLGADLLTRVLKRLDASRDGSIQQGIGDDAAIVDFGSSRIATSCDSFRAMITDPWSFGRIAAHHALNDLYAVGGTPRIALAIATIPFMAERLMEEDLYQTMAGALSVFDECDVRLVGGHSAEGLELSLGFAVSGTVSDEPLLKSGLKKGQALILSKPIGTGVLLAAAMQQKVRASDVLNAVATMDSSNAVAAQIFIDHGCSALTDITGFGLAGHVAELVSASQCNVKLNVRDVPVLSGSEQLMQSGLQSTLQESNEGTFALFTIPSEITARCRLLADPQTCGGLLGAVDSQVAEDCVQELCANGYPSAACIGSVTGADSSEIAS